MHSTRSTRCNQQDSSCVSSQLPALVQGSDVFICVYSGSPNVQVVGISGLSFTQGSISVASIIASNPDAVTAVSQYTMAAGTNTPAAQGSMIHSKMRSEFFVSPTPAPLVANGFAILSFGRRLHMVPLPRILQQGNTTTGDFDVTLNLTPAAAPVSKSWTSKTALMIAVLASVLTLLIMAATFLIYKRRYPRGARRCEGTLTKADSGEGNETEDGDDSHGAGGGKNVTIR